MQTTCEREIKGVVCGYELEYIHDDFRYCDKCHIYELLENEEWTILPGVTTILEKTIPKPLTWYGSGKALEPLGWTNPKLVPEEDGIYEASQFFESSLFKEVTDSMESWYDFLQKCYRNHDTFKKTRAKEGTGTHELVENYILYCIKENKGEPILLDDTPNEKEATKKFARWAVENVDKFLEAELKTLSRKHRFAGTLDFLFEKDGKIYIGDIKTGKSIYDDYYFQMGAYWIALEEIDYEIAGTVIVRLHFHAKKKEWHLQDKWSNTEIDKKIFLNCLTQYNDLKQFKEQHKNG